MLVGAQALCPNLGAAFYSLDNKCDSSQSHQHLPECFSIQSSTNRLLTHLRDFSLNIHTWEKKSGTVLHTAVRSSSVRVWMVKAAHRIFTSSPVDLELNRDFNGDDYEYEDEAKLVIFPDHFEIPLPNIEELPALVSELLLHGSLCLCRCFGVLCYCMLW